MIRSLIAVARPLAALILLTASAITQSAGNTTAAAFGLLAAVVLFIWAAQDIDWAHALRPRRIDGIPDTRAMRQILLVLLTDDPELWLMRIVLLAEVGLGTAHLCLDRLEMARWARANWGPEPTFGPRLRFYRLTETGRAYALDLLGLADRPEVPR